MRRKSDITVLKLLLVVRANKVKVMQELLVYDSMYLGLLGFVQVVLMWNVVPKILLNL